MVFQAKRDQFVVLKNADIANKDITKQLIMLHNVWKHYNFAGTTSNKQTLDRPKNIRTGKNNLI